MAHRITPENQRLWDAHDRANWSAYDAAAMDLARKGLKGAYGDPLPLNMSTEVVLLINEDVEAFQQRVRQCAYAYERNLWFEFTD